MPEKIELNEDNVAKNFVQAIQEGIRNSMSKPISNSEMKKQLAEESREREKRASEFISSRKKPTNTDLVKIIQDKFVTASNETKLRIQTIMKDNNITSFLNPENLDNDVLQSIVDVLG